MLLAHQPPTLPSAPIVAKHTSRSPASSRSSSSSPTNRSSTHGGSQGGSSSSRTSPSPPNPRTPLPTDEVNPLFRLSEDVTHGDLKPFHISAATEGDFVARRGPEPSFAHPSTWVEKPLLLSELSRARRESPQRERARMSDQRDRSPPEGVKHFQDHDMQHSRRDTLRMNEIGRAHV